MVASELGPARAHGITKGCGFGPDRRVTPLQVQYSVQACKGKGKVGAAGPLSEVSTVIGLVNICQGYAAGRLVRVTGTDGGFARVACGAGPRDRTYQPRRNLDNESGGLSLTHLVDDVFLVGGMLPIHHLSPDRVTAAAVPT